MLYMHRMSLYRQGECSSTPNTHILPPTPSSSLGKNSIHAISHLAFAYPVHRPYTPALTHNNSALESRGLVDVVVTMRELLDASLHNPDAAVLGPDGGDGDRTEDEERADRMESIAASAARKRRGNNSAMAA